VPSVRRRIVVLLGAACLAAAVPAVPALAQGAGDQQYQDPFGGSGTSTTGSGSGGSGSSGAGSQTQTTPSGNLEPLSPSPQNAGSSGSSGSSSATTTTTPSTPAASGQALPNTGADVRLLALAGGALLLTGLGLRLRSAPERS
jgi:LPXTG-motif cell wall-anchored protein